MLGAQVNNSSGWPAMLPKVWPAMEYLHANTVEIPVYWEQFEPRQGQFDYSAVDALLTQARAHRLRLVLLWFGAWKNGSQHYMPEWMKLAPERYTHVVDKTAVRWIRRRPSPPPRSRRKSRPSPLYGHLKAADPQRTVLMVQVENEPGTWGALRDYSPEAQKLFDGPVQPRSSSHERATGAPSPSWQAAFGPRPR